MIAEKIPQLKTLTSEEKLLLVGEIWNELAAQPNAFPPRKDHVEILQARLDRYQKNPEDVVAWEDLKARILASR